MFERGFQALSVMLSSPLRLCLIVFTLENSHWADGSAPPLAHVRSFAGPSSE